MTASQTSYKNWTKNQKSNPFSIERYNSEATFSEIIVKKPYFKEEILNWWPSCYEYSFILKQLLSYLHFAAKLIWRWVSHWIEFSELRTIIENDMNIFPKFIWRDHPGYIFSVSLILTTLKDRLAWCSCKMSWRNLVPRVQSIWKLRNSFQYNFVYYLK